MPELAMSFSSQCKDCRIKNQAANSVAAGTSCLNFLGGCPIARGSEILVFQSPFYKGPHITMDPLTALGLAGNVVQFVDFALDLISTGAEIADSARGATERTLELEKVYNTLKTFTSKLGPKGSDLTLAADISEGNEPLSGLAGGGKAIKAHATALEEIAVDCKTLCDQLLNMVKGLRVKEGTSNPRIRSLGIALKTAFAGKKVNELEERLKRFQALIALHFFPLLKFVLLFVHSSHSY